LLSIRESIVGCRASPHQPTIILRVARFQAVEASPLGAHIHAALRDGRLKDDRFAQADTPKLLARSCSQAIELSVNGAKKEFAVHGYRRRQDAVENGNLQRQCNTTAI